MKHILTTILLLLSLSAFSQTVLENSSFYGPYTFAKPFADEDKSPEDKSFELSSFLDNISVDEEAYNFNAFPKYKFSGYKAKFEKEKGLLIQNPDSQNYHVFVQNVYLENPDFSKLKLKVNSNAIFRISENGQTLLENLNRPDSSVSKDVEKEMLKGFHPLTIKLMNTAAQGEIQFKLIIEKDSALNRVIFHTESKKPSIDLYSLANMSGVSSAKINSEGTKAAITISKKASPKGKSESWLEFWDLKSKKIIRSYRGLSEMTSIDWVPGKEAISYIRSNDKKKSIWIHPLNAEPYIILGQIENISSYQWSDNGEFIIYSIRQKPDKKDKKTNLLDGMASRLPGYDNYSYLYKLDISSGKITQLTFGENSTSLKDISSDGSKIIFTTDDEDYLQLPYSYSTYWEMNLNNGKTDSLFTLYWGGGCEYFPDGKKILISGGPSLFEGIGENVREGQKPNGYDGQAYIFDLESKEAIAISKEFDPSISSMDVSGNGEEVYLICTDKDYRTLYKYNLEEKSYEKLMDAPDLIRSLDLNRDNKKGLITASNAQGDNAVYLFDPRKMKLETLHDPSFPILKDKLFGEINSWTFENENGDVIDGRFYLPPDFDSTKNYPLIVYYYGGTTPVSRSFGGRYPYNWYAAQGYVVYILQPRGSIGYGQSFSAEHVNNWGKTTAKDIILGTKKFTKSHPFIDTTAIGCIGASYGGFMTMYLTTQTDIFSAAVSHAGISALSSYWGEGFWGYAYSAVASEAAFPWNRKDIYVDQSPLFQADKVNTPILLTHGTSDTNVPPGESYQFYTALKILGKEVEMLEVPGQNHWVVDYEQYIEWKYSIIAWFDKHLKKKDDWWNSLYK
ncbi:MAG: S9 family peptidase [Cytophagales bacterium]